MASIFTENCVAGDILIVKELTKHLEYSPSQTKFVIELAKSGQIAVETMLENAISKIGKLMRSSKKGEDFIDGSDAKKAITWQVDKNLYSWRRTEIGNLKNKRGILRCMVADSISQELYYFKFPHSAYKGKQKILIPFDRFGFQATNSRSSVWNYQVSSFEELCS